MDTGYLQEFVTLADTLSFSEAAFRRHISQSALTRHIHALEKELDEPLFARTTRRTALTEFGALFLPYARRIAETAEEASGTLSLYKKAHSRDVLLGISHFPSLYNITRFVMEFRDQHPETSMQFVQASLAELELSLSGGALRLITTAVPDDERFPAGFIPAGRGHIVAMLPPRHPLAGRETLSLQDLAGARLILPERHTFFNRLIRGAFEKAGIRPGIVYEGSPMDALLILHDTSGILLMEKAQADENRGSGLTVRELAPAVSFTYGLRYHGNLTRDEDRFVRFVREKAGEIGAADI